MVGEFLNAIVSWETLLVSLLVFGFAPGAVLRLIALAYDRDDPRRSEMLAELYRVPRLERPYWVIQQLEVALFEAIWERILWGPGPVVSMTGGTWSLESSSTVSTPRPSGFPMRKRSRPSSPGCS
jgi:hypothetical protein